MPELQYGEAKNQGDNPDDSFCSIVRKLPPVSPETCHRDLLR